MSEHRQLLGICLSHRLCPKCRRGYLSRKKRLSAVCPNPECSDMTGTFVEFTYIPPVVYRGAQDLLRPIRVRRIRYKRVPFRLGRTILSHQPAEGTLWTWLSERDAARAPPR